MSDIAKTIQQYIHSCRTIKRLDAKTLKAYRCDLNQFETWLQSAQLDFERDALVEYIAHLNTIYSPSSVKRKVASLKAFANYRETEGLCHDNPFRLLKLVMTASSVFCRSPPARSSLHLACSRQVPGPGIS